MRVRWTPAAAEDLKQISDYLSVNSPQYRQATLLKLYQSISQLKRWPHSGRAGAEPGTREIAFPPLPYVAVYRVEEQAIHVLRIYHGAQDR